MEMPPLHDETHEQLKDLQWRIGDLEKDLDRANNRLERLENRIDRLSNKIDRLADKLEDKPQKITLTILEKINIAAVASLAAAVVYSVLS